MLYVRYIRHILYALVHVYGLKLSLTELSFKCVNMHSSDFNLHCSSAVRNQSEYPLIIIAFFGLRASGRLMCYN